MICLLEKIAPFSPLRFAILLVITLLPSIASAGAIDIEIGENCNIFDATKPVTFRGSLSDVGAGSGHVDVTVVDYRGQSQASTRVEVVGRSDGPIRFEIDLGRLPVGYYELGAAYTFSTRDGKTQRGQLERTIPVVRKEGDRFNWPEPFSFGVAPFYDRTPQQVLSEGRRFGLKVWQLGKPGIWWRNGEAYDVSKFIEATTALGLNWTRLDFSKDKQPDEPGKIETHELIGEHSVVVLHKVEGYPYGVAWDEQRYGDYETYKKKHSGGKPLNRRTVPKKEPYQEWLKGLVEALPEDQRFFEIGNEPYNYPMSPEDYAQWVTMAAEAIHEVRPEAIVAADLGGKDFAYRYVKAGGLDPIDATIMHPYSFTPLPEHRIRQQLRAYDHATQVWAGKKLPRYISEYGWATAPEDRRGHSVSEPVQAMRTTRTSLMLYAEGCQALVPHWTADRELDITEREHWFGFFRLRGMPKPVLMAHATCARMIDGSQFVGDLWFGPNVGAMLFDRDGELTLALWTDETDRSVQIDVDADRVRVVDMMGGEEERVTDQGQIQLLLDGAPTYLVGVGEALRQQAAGPEVPLRTDRWELRDASPLTAQRVADIAIDGKVDEWRAPEATKLRGGGTLQARVWAGYDDDAIYLALESIGIPPSQIKQLRVGVSSLPSNARMGLNTTDFFFDLEPNDRGDSKLTLLQGLMPDKKSLSSSNGPTDLNWAGSATDRGWNVELRIPRTMLEGVEALQPGTTLAVSWQLSAKEKDQAVSLGDRYPRSWPLLILE